MKSVNGAFPIDTQIWANRRSADVWHVVATAGGKKYTAFGPTLTEALAFAAHAIAVGWADGSNRTVGELLNQPTPGTTQ